VTQEKKVKRNEKLFVKTFFHLPALQKGEKLHEAQIDIDIRWKIFHFRLDLPPSNLRLRKVKVQIFRRQLGLREKFQIVDEFPHCYASIEI
jgi:hypothetical protein